MEPDKETRKLPVKLTRDEYDAKASELAAKLMLAEEMKASLKSVTKNMNDQIAGVAKEIGTLTGIVRTRIEERDVECVEIRDEDRMVMHVVRCDTKDIVETRPMSAAERQLVMFPTSRLRVVGEAVVEEESQAGFVATAEDGSPLPEQQQPSVPDTPAEGEKVSGDTTTMPAPEDDKSNE
jgi:hypothetical protein